MNKVFIVGRLGGNPDLKTSGESKYANFSVATSEYYDGEEQTEWHSITAFGDMASNITEYFGKGDQIVIHGRLSESEYTDNEGVKRYSTDIIAQEFEFGAPKGAGKNKGAGGGNTEGSDPNDEPFDDDDIPF